MSLSSRKLKQIRKYNGYCVNGGGWSFEQWEINGSPNSPKHKNAKSKVEVTDRKSMPKAAPDEWPADYRIDAIGQNGGDGEHYDVVNNPKHYTSHPSGIDCIQITRFHSFCIGNAIKYIWRHKDKGSPIQDLEKAIFYLKQEIELYGQNSEPSGE